jgi:hypothetical protein
MHDRDIHASEHKVNVAGLPRRTDDSARQGLFTTVASANTNASTGDRAHWVTRRCTAILRTVAHLQAF